MKDAKPQPLRRLLRWIRYYRRNRWSGVLFLVLVLGWLVFGMIAPTRSQDALRSVSTVQDPGSDFTAAPSFRDLLNHRAEAATVEQAGKRFDPLQTNNKTGPAERVTVDFTAVVSDVSRHPLGINLNYWTDDDNNYLLPPGHLPLETSLNQLGVKYLRYPGGWKSEQNFWSTPPYTFSNPVLARPDLWPGSEPILVQPDGSWTIDPMDFDEFMALCRRMGAEPYVVVPLMPYRRRAGVGVAKPTRQQIIDHAVAWVTYANQIRSYGVKYWEIGNETYLEADINADIYGVDANEIALAMKQIDPSIWVGVGGENPGWFYTVLRRCAASIDFLSIHAYPFWRRSSAEYFVANPNALMDVKEAREAIRRLPAPNNTRIKIIVSEWAAGSLNANDAEGATVERGLMTFDLQGQLLQSPDVEFSQFWTTHNVYEIWNSWNQDEGALTNGALDALRPDGTLSAVGLALKIWSENLNDTMLATTSTPNIRCFATYSAERGLNIFLINKSMASRPVVVTLNRAPAILPKSGETWVYSGLSKTDQNPTWANNGAATVQANQIDLTLDATSMTMIALQKL